MLKPTSRRAERAKIPTPRPQTALAVVNAPSSDDERMVLILHEEEVLPQHLIARDQGGRPSAAELAANPPVPVEAIEIPQPPRIGLRNPPCCGSAMMPRGAKRISDGRYRCTCGACGKRLVVTYDHRGYPVMARVV